MNKKQEQLENTFSPDLRVWLDKEYRITSALALTEAGGWFIAHYKVIGRYYDLVLRESEGICFEVVEDKGE
jgi:hypothetical protein